MDTSARQVLNMLGYEEAKKQGDSDDKFLNYLYLLYCEDDIPEPLLLSLALELGFKMGEKWEKMSEEEKKAAGLKQLNGQRIIPLDKSPLFKTGKK